jgi:hypothetical protein
MAGGTFSESLGGIKAALGGVARGSRPRVTLFLNGYVALAE